jgi:hypothetical protein
MSKDRVRLNPEQPVSMAQKTDMFSIFVASDAVLCHDVALRSYACKAVQAFLCSAKTIKRWQHEDLCS